MGSTRTVWVLWLTLLLVTYPVLAKDRKKRQNPNAAEDSAQPMMVTDHGHLTFQTAANHNITFQTAGTGRVMIGAVDVQEVVDRVDKNEQDIQTLKTSGIPSDVQQQIDGVKSDVTDLTSRVSTLETQGPGDLATRVATLERTVQTLTNDLSINECQNNPCQHGGTCINLYLGFQCRCVPGWQGETCVADVNECATISGTEEDCQNTGQCVNTQGSFRCNCPANWFGPQCTIRYDDCSTASHTALCGHGFCVNDPRIFTETPKYSCVCLDGWQSDGSSNPACTQDINECEADHYPCSLEPRVRCINVPGTYYCGPCPAGYTGNGHECSDVNECLINNGGCSLSPLVQCVNTRGSRQCSACPAGYVGDGVTCLFVGICRQNNGGCSQFATCVENTGAPNGRICTCNPGYTGNGEGSHGCIPTTGATCQDNPCINGRCETLGTTFRCVCEPGWQGDRCGEDVDECETLPCANGGTCHNLINGFNCDCASGYSGERCQDERQSCGGYLNGASGFFEFPPLGQLYDHRLSCAWVITVQNNKVVHITFTRFKLEDHVNCDYDFLQINDGASAVAQTLGRFCGEEAPAPITSTHSQLYFWFRSDGSQSYEGFGINWSSQDPVCGGDLTGSNHGNINSPGYPGNYPVNRDCVWTVTVDAGMYITFAFGTLQLEHHETCNFDYLEIRDGLTESFPSLGKFCSTISPGPVQTTGPYAFLRFHSDTSLTDSGFHVTYTSTSFDPGCGGVMTDDSAIIISPNYPNPYPHDAECIWTIQIQDNGRILFTITDLLIEEQDNCLFDYVELRDGFDETAPFVGRYCHSTAVPPPIVSTSNTLWVKFKTDLSVSAGGFRATYESQCGGIFSDPSQELLSPYFPNSYPHDKTCEYIINALQGQVVVLTFVTFDIEAHLECNFDYLEVRDGASADATLIDTLCGSALPADVSSNANSMYLKFVTDGSVANYGFRATFRFEDAGPGGCGGQFTDGVGIIASPPHPQGYPHGLHCVYVVTVIDGYVIRLTFNSFSLESSRNCNFDYIQIYDNSTDAVSPDMGRYCGSDPPPILTTSGNVMTVIFHTDSSIALEGFAASYVALDATTVCGGELSTTTGVITSPNYPDNYPHNRQCVWVITVPAGQQISVNFTDFSMELHLNCAFDNVELRNGGYATSPLIGTFCGHTINPTMYTSHSNKMYIKFESDISLSDRGFSLTYDGTATGCGGTLNTPTGGLVSPNYPYPYGHNAQCFWLITTNQGSTLYLTFADLDLETHGTCTYDYVKVYDGLTEINPLLGTFCGTEIPAPIQSTGNSLRVKFRTDYSGAGSGFHAVYQANCDNIRLTDYNGIIESPNFPDPYPHNRDCTWIIETTEGNTVNLTFTSLNLEFHTSCNFDYIEVRDGQEDNSPLIGDQLCGETFQPEGVSFTTTSQYMLIKFHSDSSVASAGFRASYSINGCGGELTDNTGTLSSPNYPSHYDHNRICTWTITVDYGHAITLTITDFDVESSNDCNYDALTVYSGTDANGQQLAQICHTQTSDQQVSTTGRNMYVYFRSDASINGRGFTASYQSIDGGCGGNFSTPTGDFHSHNYPNNYDHNTDCTWLITVDPQHRVQLTFVDFNLEGASCRFDYVKVYDGPSQSYPVLLTQCGVGLPSPATIYSTGRQMFIHMLADGSVSRRGFHATYQTACGGRLDATQTGVLTSTNYPAAYPANQNCTWIIESANPSDRVTLTFTHMDIEESVGGCDHDSVTLYEGNDVNAPQIAQLCGSTIPAPVTTFGAAVTVTFTSDYSNQQTGFRATYSTSLSVCGADLTSLTGTFSSPGYPANYPQSTECVWSIISSPGNLVEVSFSVFNIETDCSRDYLEARVGNENGALIGRFCGTGLPSNLTSSGSMWLKFRSDDSGTGAGFLANFGQVFGGTFIAPSGQIASPLYPRNYPSNLDAKWSIYVTNNYRVRLTFTAFAVERGFFFGCNYDVVTIYDGADADAPILLSACGASIPDPVESTGSVATVRFRTDGSTTDSGWLLEWVEVTSQVTGVLPTLPPGECGGVLAAGTTPLSFSSPNFPNGYDINLHCSWLIETNPGRTIQFQFTALNLESHQTCNYDYIQLYDGSVDSATSLGKYCTRQDPLPAPIFSTSNVLLAVFHSDISFNGTGFQASYQSYCGGRLTSNVGTITSPLYPSNYPSNQHCVWVVEVAAGTTIQVTFQTSFSIVTSTNCNNDYVKLLNGGEASSPVLGRYCGTSPPAQMETNSNLLRVEFGSDGSGASSGFSLSYQTLQQGCGGQIELSSSYPSSDIMSPNYPNDYPHNVECIWTVTAPSGQAIGMTFDSQFYIEIHGSCNFDYIQILDGSSESAAQLGKFCGTTAPDTVSTTGNAAFIRFRTDRSRAHVGFKLTASIAQCGGTIVGATGVVTSPGFPNLYPSNLDCTWTIRAPDGHYIRFSFDSNFIITNSAADCSGTGDVLTVNDGRNSSAFELARVCGSSAPPGFDTSANYALVHFTTDSSEVAVGFSLSFESSTDVCGGDLATATGTFTSPLYPQQYSHSRICEWRITVAVGQVVTLVFDDFELEGGRCRYDYVEIFNGLDASTPSLGRFCGNIPPQGMVSTGNTMRVVFFSDGTLAFRGFSARYDSQDASVCGALINVNPGDQGLFSSIGYGTLNYTNNLNCQWLLANQAIVNTSLYLQFSGDFDIETGANCRYDRVEVFAGVDFSAPRVGVFCGSTLPDPIFIPQPSAFVRFITDGSQIGGGFRILYSASQCGGLLGGTDGVITSPNYPNEYDHNDHCAWLIQGPAGTTITLTFTTFDIESHEQCQYDYLSVRNGGTFQAPQISGENPWCGSTAPPSITTASNQILMVFMTDGTASAGGFRIEWTTATRGCGGTYHGNTGSFQTSNFPSAYPANDECIWVLMVETGYHVRITFNSFSIGSGDTVNVYDGDSDIARQLGSYSGTTVPAPVTSSLNVITVKFRSDGSNQATGFQADWSVGCGATFTGVSTARIVSPGFPERSYPNSITCDYTINWDPLQSLAIFFDDTFAIEESFNCNYDSLQIWGGTDDAGTLLGNFCGTEAPTNILWMGPVFLRFHTDSNANDVGFGLGFEPGCGGTFTQSSGVVQTPSHLETYRHNQNCTWLLRVTAQRSVSLKFTLMDIELHRSCRFDYIEIYDGPDTSAPLLVSRLCGAVPPPDPIISTDNTMLVRFISDFSVSGEGFRAAYEEVIGPALGCGATFNNPSGTIASVSLPGNSNYENNLNCAYFISVEINKVIELTFTGTYRIEGISPGRCSYDYLEIRDGYGFQAPLVNYYCGRISPSPITLSTNQAFLRFVSDGTQNYAGFTLNYASVDPVCGATYNATDTPQTIVSPNYPNTYPHNSRCTWFIGAPEDTHDHVRIRVTSFEVEDHSNCNYDYLEFRDVPVTDGQILRYCGTDIPPVFDSVGPVAQIYFMTDQSSSGTGFSLTYSIADCNKNYTNTNGRVSSPGYPQIYHRDYNCDIGITSPAGSYLALYFNDFNVEFHLSCQYDSLRIYDGSDNSSTLLRTLCGSYIPDPVFLTSNTAYLNFVTDPSVSFAGYDLTFTSSTLSPGCGGSLNGRVGSFTSPNFPFEYAAGLECGWSIKVPSGGNRLTLEITSLGIEGDEGVCNEDYLHVYDGRSSSSRTIGRYCGTSLPATLTASSRQMYVRFVTDAQNAPNNGTFSGFRAVYRS